MRFVATLLQNRLQSILSRKYGNHIASHNVFKTRDHWSRPGLVYLLSCRNSSSDKKSTKSNQNFYTGIFLAFVGLGVGTVEFLNQWKRTSLDFPYVIVGSDTTALMAAQGIRLQNPKAKVLMISEDGRLPLQKSFLPMYLLNTDNEYAHTLQFEYFDKEGKPKLKSVFHEEASYYMDAIDVIRRNHGGVAVLKRKKVKDVDVGPSKEIHLDDKSIVKYDKCFISAARKYKNLSVFESASQQVKDRILVISNTVSDFVKLYRLMQPGKKLLVVGGGLAATELSTTLQMKAKEFNLRYDDDAQQLHVSQLFSEEGVLADVLPEYLSDWASELLQAKHKMHLYRKEAIVKCDYDQESDKLVLELSGRDKLSVDHVIVMNEAELDRKSYLKQFAYNHEADAIAVDDKFQAANDVYIAGEGVCFKDKQLGHLRHPTGQFFEEVIGKLAGENMAGSSRSFAFQPYTSGYFFNDFHLSCFGVCDSSLKTIAYFPEQLSVAAGNQQGQVERYKGKGIVFYVDKSKIVGVLMWNIMGSQKYYLEDTIRQVLRSAVDESNVHEVAKKFKLNTFDEFLEERRRQYGDDAGDDDAGVELPS